MREYAPSRTSACVCGLQVSSADQGMALGAGKVYTDDEDINADAVQRLREQRCSYSHSQETGCCIIHIFLGDLQLSLPHACTVTALRKRYHGTPTHLITASSPDCRCQPCKADRGTQAITINSKVGHFFWSTASLDQLFKLSEEQTCRRQCLFNACCVPGAHQPRPQYQGSGRPAMQLQPGAAPGQSAVSQPGAYQYQQQQVLGYKIQHFTQILNV